MVVTVLGFSLASYISYWMLEKTVIQEFQWGIDF
jgi:hypothetical protein